MHHTAERELRQVESIDSSIVGHLASRSLPALRLLLQGYVYALDSKRSVWDFAVDIAHLRDSGLHDNDFRWLVCQGFVEHAREVTHVGQNGREFRTTGDLTFTRRTCFALTADGARLFRLILAVGERSSNGMPSSANPVPNGDRVRPDWDRQRRELRFNGQLVKCFKLPSPNQEKVLSAFEEEGWPARIDDPLPAAGEQNPKRRLHDTIRSLNRNQKMQLVRFKGDGTGEGILWEARSLLQEPAV